MATVATALFHSSTRVWDERPPLLLPLCNISAAGPKSSFSPFLPDSPDGCRGRHRRRPLLACASPIKGSTKEAEQSLDNQRPLITAQDIEEHPAQADVDGGSSTDVLRCVEQEAQERLDGIDAIGAESKLQDERDSDGNMDEGNLISGDTALKGTIVAGLLLVGVVGGFGAASYLYRDQINDFLLEFSDFIEGYGAAGYALFVAVYAGLEILAIPAIPLTMSAGLLFGTAAGTIIVSISGTIAATAAFLIARYLARDRILDLAKENKKFLAIDKAIGENGFRVVALLRLSPLLPFSLGNYLYGLTSVKLVPYILGSWLGMLPGTWAYVSAGAVGRAIIQQEADGVSGGPEHYWTLGLGLLVTVFAATYVTRLAKDAVKGIDE